MKRRPRNPFSGVLAHLSLLGSLGVLAIAMATNGDGGAGNGDEGDLLVADNDTAPEADTGTDEAPVVSMSQADFDRMIDKATGKAKSQSEAAFKKWLEAQSLSEADQAKVAREAAEAERDAARAEVLDTKIEGAAQRAAIRSKVDPDRVDRFMRLVDLKADDLVDDGKPDVEAIAAAVAATLAEFPEFLTAGDPAANGRPKPKGSSAGQHTGDAGGQTFTRAQIASMSAKEFADNEAAIDAAMKAGKVK